MSPCRADQLVIDLEVGHAAFVGVIAIDEQQVNLPAVENVLQLVLAGWQVGVVGNEVKPLREWPEGRKHLPFGRRLAPAVGGAGQIDADQRCIAGRQLAEAEEHSTPCSPDLDHDPRPQVPHPFKK